LQEQQRALHGRRSQSINAPDKENAMKHDNEAIVRHAYHTAEGSVLDIAGFVGAFTEDGVINLGHAGQEYGEGGLGTYRGDQRGQLVLDLARMYPDVHRELYRVNVLGGTVAVELAVQGTQSTGVRVNLPCADFWYVRDGKIERFDCYIMLNATATKS
jgi:ketosteroid isomerase-like protein